MGEKGGKCDTGDERIGLEREGEGERGEKWVGQEGGIGGRR